MLEQKITCDQCGHDLTLTSNCEDWRIVLKSEPIPSREGFVTSMAILPPLHEIFHFCGNRCLKDWVATNG